MPSSASNVISRARFPILVLDHCQGNILLEARQPDCSGDTTDFAAVDFDGPRLLTGRAGFTIEDHALPVDLEKMTDEAFVLLHPDSLEQDQRNEQLLQQLRSHSRILAHSDLAIAAIAQTTGPQAARIRDLAAKTVPASRVESDH